MRSDKYPLVYHPAEPGQVYQKITAEEAGWDHLNLECRVLRKDERWEGNTGEYEYGFILLSGDYTVKTNRGNWQTAGGRATVFSGIAYTLYLPPLTDFTFIADSQRLDLAAGYCRATTEYDARFKTPAEAAIEIRGGDNATRQINSLIEPGFGSSKLVAVEVYTPGGNWSSFPPHKHDKRQMSSDGTLLEADLEEFYFYKFKDPKAYAIQHVYTSDNSLNELMQLRNNDVVVVPEGYHPVVAAHGYDCYYLNFLAGTDQSLANTPDPDHQWIFNTWQGRDPRIPMVTADNNTITE